MRYIGSKTLLLDNIQDILNKHLTGKEKTFLDLFGGTNVVGNYFKEQYTVFSNDILYFSYVNAKATIENNGNLQFEELIKQGISSPIDYLQEKANDYLHEDKVGYYEKAYSPTGGVMYLSVDNAKRIDFIRDTIDVWRDNGWLLDTEYYYLVSTLVEAVPYVSNTTGTYGAFLKHWDKRALKPLELKPLEVIDNNNHNKAYNEDSNELVKKLEVDIVYIDTPYNNRQYASNYHVLENIAKNNKPPLKGKTHIFEWKELRSDYAMKNKAYKALEDLLSSIQATHIVLSYNNEGIITEDELITLLKKYSCDGIISIERFPYRKYKSKKPSETDELYELLIYIQRKPTTLLKEVSSQKIQNKISTWTAKKDYIKSPLNYIGGKHKLLKQIMPLFPNEIHTFVDLFSGGANVGINVKAKRHIFNDMNYRINEMFRYFSTKKTDELVETIKARIDEYGLSKTNEEAYLKFRADYNNNPNPLDLYVLVSYSYNYQFRFNNSMEFNNPFGRNRSQFSQNMEKNLRTFVAKLETMDAVFTDYLFTELDLSALNKNDFVYLDPPYLITTGNYNDGNRGFVNWGEEQELAMYNLMTELTAKGVRWALSNVTEHKGRSNEYLKSFIERSNVEVNYLDFNYDNSSHNTKGTGSVEVLITNYNPQTFELLKNLEYATVK